MITSPAQQLIVRAVANLAAINRGIDKYGLTLNAEQRVCVHDELDGLKAEIAKLVTALVYAEFAAKADDVEPADDAA